ncbi:hypothetical protein [Defluviimonas salinarum]|uniref:Alpha/beta hydrolase n=1 Tax=Defluviimonas salinarum TaxID=2992147 RepID=A0ABT3J7Z8_9RHOB|nr:hypothetical protein [Defluviimonas salinarum]MCW3783808.1 hypothetical protein [Defluviimonas salinarum]
MIAFSLIGHDPARRPSPEFVATAIGRGTGASPRRALFVMDESRSWGNDPGFAPVLRRALDRVAARAPVTQIATTGQSMGAFSALVAARTLPVDVVVDFSPQWSVMPGVVPGEDRWARWTARLSRIDWPTAPLPAAGGDRTCLFHGAVDDLPHARHFPCQTGTDQLLFPGLGHFDLVPHLKVRGVLSGVMEAALAGDRQRILRQRFVDAQDRRDLG